MESKELAMQIAKLLDSKKATRVKVLKVRGPDGCWRIISSSPAARPPPM